MCDKVQLDGWLKSSFKMAWSFSGYQIESINFINFIIKMKKILFLFSFCANIALLGF